MSTQSQFTTIDNPPDPARIMNGLRDTGYDFNTAVADIIDNSIAAGADNIYVSVQREPVITVSIADDGCGMDEAGLRNAMKYGSADRQDQSADSNLGKFGLGLKTASTAFCRKLSVISRPSADAPLLKVCWDLDYIAEVGTWSLQESSPTEEEVELLDEAAYNHSGTLVYWENVDRLLKRYDKESSSKRAFKRCINGLHHHIAMTYQRFLDPDDDRARHVNIYLNDDLVAPYDPFCLNEENTELLINDEIGLAPEGEDDEAIMLLRAYAIPHKDDFSSQDSAKEARISNDYQGFYIYRENRLIHFGGWMEMFKAEQHHSLLRVELSFDHKGDDYLYVDIKKSRILLNDELYDFIQRELEPAWRQAEQKYRQRDKKVSANAPDEAHRPANNAIESKAHLAEVSRITEADPQTNEATVENNNGTVHTHITITSKNQDGLTRVIPVSELDSGELWDPMLADGKKAVGINKSHPFYQKVYYPQLNNQNAVEGMDFLLWALSEAELGSFTEDSQEFFRDMKLNASRILEKLVSDLPDPDEE